MRVLVTITFLVMSLLTVNQADANERALRSELATRFLLKDLGLQTEPVARETARILTEGPVEDELSITLNQSHVGDIHLLLRGPHGFSSDNAHDLRGLLLVTGAFGNKNNIRLINNVAGTVSIGIDYPDEIEDLLPRLAKDPGLAVQFIRRTPGGVVLTLKWLQSQAWLRASELDVIGVSLGGLFLPSALHMAQHLGLQPSHTIFAFTGADLKEIVNNLMDGVVPTQVQPVLGQAILAASVLHDPELHVPYLTGQFLVIRADQDQVIPQESTQVLYDLLSGPKQLAVVHGTHISTGGAALIAQTAAVVEAWLKSVGE